MESCTFQCDPNTLYDLFKALGVTAFLMVAIVVVKLSIWEE